MKKLLVAFLLLLTATVAPASLRQTVRHENHTRIVRCYRSCPFYRDRCRNVFVKGCLFKRCYKEMLYSCLGNPANTQCARPCSQLNSCPGGQQCAQGQCIIDTPLVPCPKLPPLTRPKPPTTQACGGIFCPIGIPYCNQGTSTCVAYPPGVGPPTTTTTTTIPPAGCPAGFPTDCHNGFCCPSGATCNATGCCGGQYPVACGDYCCTPGSVCGQGGCTDPCPAGTPVACGNPLVCCTAGSVCGRDCNVTTSTTIPGGGNCRCYCEDGRDCTGQGNSFCGTTDGIPNACGCPVNCH